MSSFPKIPRLHAGQLLAVTCVLALLHFGGEFLKPIALAAIVSLILAPFVRRLRRVGFSNLTATLISTLVMSACVIWLGVVLAFQLAAVASDLPRYRVAIQDKAEQVRNQAVRPFEEFGAELSGAFGSHSASEIPQPSANIGSDQSGAVGNAPSRQQATSPGAALTRLIAAVSGPLGQAFVVLVLLIFILLEHESLRDRFVRLAGKARVGSTVQALGDAAQGVSRFFFSQFIVNMGFGIILGSALWLLGVPHAALWGFLSAVLRFIPYIGVLGAGAMIAAFAAAVVPGWSLMVATLALFLTLELVLANIIEPRVYGHSSGLTPLAVIVSALFWGAMWGPVGLLLSTPLTLCLVVAGRHISALHPITVMFGDASSTTAGEQLYQRALSGQSGEIARDAQSYVQRHGFAKYCDAVLLPALSTAFSDHHVGRIDASQQGKIKSALVELMETLSPVQSGRRLRQRRTSLLDANVGTHLRRMRQERLGRWQGPLDVPSRSIVLCASFGTEQEDLLIELLVRALVDVNVDARSVSLNQPPETPPTSSAPSLVSTTLLPYPAEQSFEHWRETVKKFRARLPHAIFATIKPPLDESMADATLVAECVDFQLQSFSEAVAFLSESSPTSEQGPADSSPDWRVSSRESPHVPP